MTQIYDVIVVGSGPAGVSVTYPMVKAGLKVLMVDGGRMSTASPSSQSYIASRVADTNQARWMVGRDFHSLKFDAAVSPKLRAPTHKHVFEGFAAANHIYGNDFVTLGSMAVGGLSEAWGCGVATLTNEELREYPFHPQEIRNSYATVSTRMGISGACDDDLTAYFGLDEWADPPIHLDTIQQRIFSNYKKNRSAIIHDGVMLGRSRVAALSRDRQGVSTSGSQDRFACNLSGNCLWGCSRKSLYTATYDLNNLLLENNFSYLSGFVVDALSEDASSSKIIGHLSTSNTITQSYSAKKIVLCAGTLASTRLALRQLRSLNSVSFQTCPNAAFLMWMPQSLGLTAEPAFGLGQISFSMNLSEGSVGFGSFFNTTGIPVSEFVKAIPLRKPNAIEILRGMLTSCVVGNVFLPGKYTAGRATLDENDALQVQGNYTAAVKDLMAEVKYKMKRTARRLNSVILPFSFTVGKPGGDLHYACTLPMKANPTIGESDRNGKIVGLTNIYAADGSVLPSLSAKSHTLTLMANADRIGQEIVNALSAR